MADIYTPYIADHGRYYSGPGHIVTPSVEDSQIREAGYEWPGPLPEEFFAPLHGRWGVQQQQTMSSMINYTARAFPATYDEAMRDSRENALAMRRDDIIRSAMHHLQIPISVADWQHKARDKKDQQQVGLAAAITDCFDEFPAPGFPEFVRMLSERAYWGRYGVHTKWGWDWSTGERRMLATGLRPLNGDKIVFTWAGDVGVLVNPSEYKGPVVATDRGVCHFLTQRERESIFISEFQPEDPDFYEPILGGALHGIGYRGMLYWIWWLRVNSVKMRTAWMRRASNGFLQCFFDANDDSAKDKATQMIKDNSNSDVWLWPRTRDKESAWGLEYTAPSLDGAKFWYEIENELNDRMRFAIMGETLTTAVKATGMGEGTSELHGQTADDRTKYHLMGIGQTVQQVTNMVSKYIRPGVRPPKSRPMVDKRNPEEFMAAAQFAVNLGVDFDEDDFREVLSFPEPQPGDGIISKLQNLNPAAMARTPEGVPMAGVPGPNGQSMAPQQLQEGETDVNGETSPQQAIAYKRQQRGRRVPYTQMHIATPNPRRFSLPARS